MRNILIILLTGVVLSCNAQSDNSSPKETKEPLSIGKLQKTSFRKELQVPADYEAQRGEMNFRHAAKLIVPAVVHVVSTHTMVPRERPQIPDLFRDFFGDRWFRDFDGQRWPSLTGGSGVIITGNGYIVTNNHVIKNADEIEVTLHDRRSYRAEIIGTDPATDLALLKIEETGLSVLKLGDSDQVEVGDWVLAGGNPFNLESTVTAGIISAKARNINVSMDQQAIESFLQTDAAMNPGNSGGALVNVKGELIGITTAIATRTGSYSGYSFAIPVNIVKKVVDDLLNYGVVQRAFLGIVIRNMNSQLATELKVKRTTGVYVDSVFEKSAAKEAGIKAGDIIFNLDDVDVQSAPQLQALIGEYRPGDLVEVGVQRKNAQMTMKATLKNVRGTTDIILKESEDLLEVLGIQVTELTEDEKNVLNVEYGIKITELKQGLIRRNTMIRKGFVILKIDNEPVLSIADFIKKMEMKRGGVLLEGIYPEHPGTRQYYAFGLDA